MSAQLSTGVKLVFRYWNCRGRVQAVRYMLEDIAYANKNVNYKDEPELLETAVESWFPKKSNEDYAGPYHSLPILHWNDKQVFGQTLTIAQLLARKFDLYGKLTSSIDDKDLLYGYIDGVVSCAYVDVIINILTCIWMMVDFVDDTNPLNRITKKIPNDLKTLNDLLKKSSTSFYYDQVEPTIADYFVFEAFTASRDYCQKLLPDEENRQALEKLEQTMKQRPAIENYLNKGLLYKRFSGSPKESEYIAKLNETQN